MLTESEMKPLSPYQEMIYIVVVRHFSSVVQGSNNHAFFPALSHASCLLLLLPVSGVGFVVLRASVWGGTSYHSTDSSGLLARTTTTAGVEESYFTAEEVSVWKEQCPETTTALSLYVSLPLSLVSRLLPSEWRSGYGST